MIVNVNIRENKNIKFLWDSLAKIMEARNVGSSDYQYLLLEGSSRSGKTWAILIFLISIALNPRIVGLDKVLIRAYRDDSTTCQDSIVADFLEIMNTFFSGVNPDSTEESFTAFDSAGKYNISRKTYTFFNGSQIVFGGAHEPQKLQGRKADITWFNEAMEIVNPARTQAEYRTSLFIICDWNPSETDHWIFDSIMTSPKSFLYCHSTYNDNKDNLSPVIIRNIEKYKPTEENIRNGTANQWLWQVYGLGQRGVRENLVFERWRWDVIEDDRYPDFMACQRHGYGIDFGFSLDPTALVKNALHNNSIYWHQLIYQRGLIAGRSYDNPNIPSIVGYMLDLGVEKSERISADISASSSIEEIRVAGYNIFGTPKPADSIVAGINILKKYRIFVTRSSNFIIKELENYAWKKKPNGEITAEPEDKNNHAIDASRYWAWDNLQAMQFDNSRKRAIRPKFNNFEEW